MDRVLILDASERNALAATRSLGARGLHVVAAGRTRVTLAGASRFCADRAVYPSPYADPEAFIAALEALVERHRIDVLLPMSDITTGTVLRHRARFPRVLLPFPEFDVYESLTDKARLAGIAQALGVRIPRTIVVDSMQALARARTELAFPAALKPVRKKAFGDAGWVSFGVSYVNSFTQARAALERAWARAPGSFLVQEYVAGQGQGLFCLYDNGAPHTFFSHRRIREKPPTGGVSVVCESVPVDPEMRQMAERLLSHVGWHGVAMAEFKMSTHGVPYLLEVNGRFWGSLQLAIDAGVDFPYLLYRLAKGEAVPAVERFRIGLRSRWLLGDLDNLYLTLKARDANGKGRSKLQALRDFLVLSSSDQRWEVNRLGDLRPFLVELRTYLRRAVQD